MDRLISFTYTNHKGDTRKRTIIVDAVEWIGNPGFGYQPGWFVSGIDQERNVRRSFALSRIHIDPAAKHFKLLLLR